MTPPAAVAGTASVAALVNRLRKNARHLARWARRGGIEAWRVDDRDMPEFPYAVDRYGSWLNVQRFAGRLPRAEDVALELAAIAAALDVPTTQVAYKLRQRQRGVAQYEKLAARGAAFVVREQGLCFEVNLTDYLDTGLFLDHRQTRQRVRAEADGRRMLNLFAYTGSFSVYAGSGGAATTLSIDLSQTYQDWTRRNLALNGLRDARRHRLLRADALTWLRDAGHRGERFDLVVLDPPSFSNSKRMQASLDIARDHYELVARALDLLASGGVLYFSTNRQAFRLDARLAGPPGMVEVTAATVRLISSVANRTCWRIMAYESRVHWIGRSVVARAAGATAVRRSDQHCRLAVQRLDRAAPTARGRTRRRCGWPVT